jgi:glutathione S-transferase
MIRFFWSARTRAARIAWLLEESGLAYERIAVRLGEESSRNDPDFRSASPMGKVPAIIDGDARLWDSGAIALYIADAYPQTGLGVPIGDPARAAFIQWSLFTNAVIEPAFTEAFSGMEKNRQQYGHGSYEQMIEVLEAGIGDGPWILGERFSAADVLIGSSVIFMKIFSLPEAERFEAYGARCRQRSAWQRAQSFETA